MPLAAWAFIRELLDGGILHEDVRTVFGEGLRPYAIEPKLGADGNVVREPVPEKAATTRFWRRFTRPSSLPAASRS